MIVTRDTQEVAQTTAFKPFSEQSAIRRLQMIGNHLIAAQSENKTPPANKSVSLGDPQQKLNITPKLPSDYCVRGFQHWKCRYLLF